MSDTFEKLRPSRFRRESITFIIISALLISSFFYIAYHTILGIDSIDDNTNRISFIVTFKQKSKLFSFKKSGELLKELDSKVGLLSEVQKLAYISNVKVIDGSNSIEI